LIAAGTFTRSADGPRSAVPPGHAAVSELTPEEATLAFDRISRSALNLTGEEFLAALDAGKFDDVDPDAHPGLLDVLMALPLVR
jgi:hypothetical protein